MDTMTFPECMQCAGKTKEVPLKHETLLRTRDEWRVFAIANTHTHMHARMHTPHTHTHNPGRKS